MLTRLLESKQQRKRSFWGTAVSTFGHTAVIAAAVFATAQARVGDPGPREIVRWVSPRVPVQAAPSAPARSVERPAHVRLPDIRAIASIDVKTVPIDLAQSLSSDPAAYGAALPITVTPSARPGGDESGEPFVADQVERQASLLRGSAPPQYPSVLRSAGVEGEVLVAFVVGVNGRAELGTLRVVKSNNALFEAAVRRALADMRFEAAEIGGLKVRQLVQMPFVFRMTR